MPKRITTQSKTLIDNIFFSVGGPSISGNLVHMISDHLPQFCILWQIILITLKKMISKLKNWSQFDQKKTTLALTGVMCLGLLDQ